MANHIIKDTLLVIREQLERALQHAQPRNQPWVSLSNVMDHQGRPHDAAQRTVVMFLANISHEAATGHYASPTPSRDGYIASPPPIYIDLHLAFFANFMGDDYPEGLALISEVLSFFQQHPRADPRHWPDLDPRINGLTFELTNTDLDALGRLMGMMGTTYLPTACYKVRMISIDGNEPPTVVTPPPGP